jgi:GTP-binding protein YchF
VPDERLDKLAELYNPVKITPAFIEFVDIAGLVRGASKGEGLGNKFLSHIREVDAVIHVVRCFEDDDIVHVDATINPERDIETINLELILSDMESVQKRYDKAVSMIKTGDKKYQIESALLKRILDCLESEKPIRSLEFDEEEKKYVDGLFLITSKPVIYAANISEEDISKDITEIELAKKLSSLSDSVYLEAENLETLVEKCNKTIDYKENAFFIKDEMLSCMAKLRASADKAETLTNETYWPYPSYGKLLFNIK